MNEKILLGFAFLSAITPSWTKICGDNEIHCGDPDGIQQCYLPVSKCDGQIDCDNADDELNCDTHNCTKEEFQCNVGNCIPATKQCDHVPDCNDNSDEEECVWVCDQTQEFLCSKTGKCISAEERCDGTLNCGGFDDSDELGCVGVCEDKQFHCSESVDNSCISSNWRCDGVTDCDAGEDEIDCPGRPSCEEGFLCDGNTKCIQQIQICDQRQDCEDAADEEPANCMTTCKSPNLWACGGHGYGYCIKAEFRCDGHTDCQDQSDEINCESPPCKDGIRCSDGSCIPAYWRCDGDDDCVGGSDEINCDRCMEGEFMCANDTCIDAQLVCNYYQDCPTGIDELHCLGLEKTCGKDSFMCDGTNKCIPLLLFCNKEDDCGDSSDERAGCTPWDSCSLDNGDCDHLCVSQPKSTHYCSCHQGYYLSEDTVSCMDIDECSETTLACSQNCTNTNGSFFCSCVADYTLSVNGYSCLAKETAPTPYIVFSNVQQMRRTTLDGRSSSLLFDTDPSNLMHIIDFHYINKEWYWVSVDLIQNAKYETVVQKRCFNNTGYERIFNDSVTKLEIRDLAVDWVTGQLYVVGERNGKGAVSLISVDLTYQHSNTAESHSNQNNDGNHGNGQILALVTQDVLHPFSLVLDPRDGLMFWTDIDDVLPGKVECSQMDGSDRQVLANNVGWANGITLDYARRKIIWIDAGGVNQEQYPGRIEEMDYSGTNRRLVKFLPARTAKPWSITTFEDSYYWTDSHNEQEAIVKCSRFNTSQTEQIRTRLKVPMAIKVVHPLRQPPGVNYCANNNCSHFCALLLQTYACLCPQGLVLQNGSVCVLPTFDVICPHCHVDMTCVKSSNPASYRCVTLNTNAGGNGENTTKDRGESTDPNKVGSISWWICLIIACLVIVVVVVGIIGCKKALSFSCKPCMNRIGRQSQQNYVQISIQPAQTMTTEITSDLDRYKKESEI